MIACFIALTCLQLFCNAQVLNDSLNQHPWPAQWITYPFEGVNQWNAASMDELHNYGVYKFRKSFIVKESPSSFIIHASGDNRYKLYVNDSLVLLGPARGDIYYWNFETADITKYLVKGKNTIAALVWNDGKLKPEAQITLMTAFILQGNSSGENIINTNNTWKVEQDTSYKPLQPHVPGYYVAGSGECINMNYYIQDWQKNEFDDADWLDAAALGHGATKDASRDGRDWMLQPSPLKQVELKQQRLQSLRKADAIKVSASFPSIKTAITIPANTKASLILDQGFLTNAYPTFIFSKGNNATVSLTYDEALYKMDTTISNGDTSIDIAKGNRNDINGKFFIGKMDSLVSDGKDDQEFTSLWWRTFRYIQINVQTKDEPLTIDDIYSTFAGYPFIKTTTFKSTDTTNQKILDIGWRTARLCAYETYMDCPYYEQLQYIGDARIQALISLYNTNNDEFVKNALTLMDHSRLPEGITQSRYPTDLDQQIPTFSLWWIGMVHDYWMYRNDSDFVKDRLPGTREVLKFFMHYQQPDGSLKNVPYWLFADWVDDRPGWNYGEAPSSDSGYSAFIDLQMMWILQQAAEMENSLGFKDYADLYTSKAAQLKQVIKQKYWDASKQMFADTEDKKLFSQHTNSLAILSGEINGDGAKQLAQKILVDTSLAPASIYFKYYLHQACAKAGLGNDYVQWLGKWRENIDSGLTTWAEMSDVSHSRSDCHAWGSSPNIEFYRIVLGIDSDAPGFGKIKIEPHLGNLKKVSGSIPHPQGNIAVSYEEKSGRWNISINIPQNTSGEFVWKNKSYTVKGGANKFVL